MRLQVLAIALLAAVPLAGCGFQLRTWELADTFHVEAQGAPALGRELEDALREAGAGIAPVADDADIVVRLANERESRRGVSLTPGARVAEYEVALVVSLIVEDEAGATIVPRRGLRAERVYSLDVNNLIGSRAEENLIRQELRADLVRRIIRNLVAATGAR